MAVEFLCGLVVLARWTGTGGRRCALVQAPGAHSHQDLLAVYAVEPTVGRDLEPASDLDLAVGLWKMRAALSRARKAIRSGGELVVAFNRQAQLHGLELEGLSDPVSAYARDIETFHRNHGQGLPWVEELDR